MTDKLRTFLHNCARFSTAHVCNNLNATAEVDPQAWAEFDRHVHEAETAADNIDALIKAARAANARLTQIGEDAEEQWDDKYIQRRSLDIFIEECLFELPCQLILDLDAALKPFQEEHDDERTPE